MKYLIYKITNGKFNYVGMTTQSLSARMAQHKNDAKIDAKTKKCSITPKLCKKQPPGDLGRLYSMLAKDPSSFLISKIDEVNGTYTDAKQVEDKHKRRL